MRKYIAMVLLLGILFSFCACAGDTAPETTPVDTFPYPTINQKLTWDAIDAFPVKSADMTPQELRQLCVDFFIFSKTALWIPDQNWEYQKTKKGNTDEMFQGVIYGGLPYIGVSSGNVYRLMDYINEDTGVVDMTEPMAAPHLFGNQCSIASYWGWARVVNSADFGWTYEMVQNRGFLRVGPYTYDDTQPRFQADIFTTKMVVEQNGPEIMYQSYAAMQLGDGMIYYTDAGHAMMCSGAPVVVYNEDGTINGQQSYLYITDQHGAWAEATNEAGDTYQHKNYVNRKMTFSQLLLETYIPFTFGEFLGTDPVEETVCTFNHSGQTISLRQLLVGEVTANYGISDLYAIVCDAKGNEVARVVNRASQSGLMTLNFFKLIPTEEWSVYADGNHTVRVVVQLGTGERPTVYEGKLTND